MRKREKKQRFLSLMLVLIMCLSLLSVCKTAYAAETDSHGTDNQQTGQVTIEFLVDSIYIYKESIQLCFEEVNTGEIYTISIKDYWKDTATEQIPVGEWSLYYVQFEEKAVYGAYWHLIGEDTFTVKEGQNIPITVSVEEHHTSTQSMYVDLVIKNSEDFNGTVQMWLEGETDSFYTETEGFTESEYSGTHVQESYTLRFDPNVGYTTVIDAGTYKVTQIYAYDAEHNPMDIAYEEYVRVGRYDDDPQIELSLYEAGTIGTVGTKYNVQLAENTPEFSLNYYYREVESYRSMMGAYEEDPFAELKENEEYYTELSRQEEEEYQEYQEQMKAEEEASQKAPEETTSGVRSEEIAFLILLICIPIAVAWFLIHRWRKKDKEKYMEHEELPVNHESDYNPYLRPEDEGILKKEEDK